MVGQAVGLFPHFMKRIHEAQKRQDNFEFVALPHSSSLLRVARRLSLDPVLAEDLVQETLLLAWRGFDGFRTGTNMRAWLFRILFNVFHGHGRRQQSRPVLVPMPVGLELELRAPDGALIDAMAVARALDTLSEEHRGVLLLAVVEGFTCREVAAILSVPIGTVMSRLNRARQALRSAVEPNCRQDDLPAVRSGERRMEKQAS
jgi:RNA polymerase sigma-70 factor, ECF subfamily